MTGLRQLLYPAGRPLNTPPTSSPLPATHTPTKPWLCVACQSTRSSTCRHTEQDRTAVLSFATGRRSVLVGLAGLALADARSARALPLAPLGPVKRVGGDKRTGLSAEEVKEVLKRDLEVGMYFVTGDLTREVFADDCRFVDPTNDVRGLSKYLTALSLLFDPSTSGVELLDIRVTGPRTIEADWKLGGYLMFPWNPRIEPLTGHTVYTLDEQGLVSEQRQTWSISGLEALRESFTPTFGPRTRVL